MNPTHDESAMSVRTESTIAILNDPYSQMDWKEKKNSNFNLK